MINKLINKLINKPLNKLQRIFLYSLFIAYCFAPKPAYSEFGTYVPETGQDLRGVPELTLCGQNLQNYGVVRDYLIRNPTSNEQRFWRKEDDLASRIAKMNCDVVAVQEVLARDEKSAITALENLAKAVRKKTNRFYRSIVGPTNDSNLRVGYLVAIDRVEVLNKVSYYKVELPKLTAEQKPRLFSRGPLELQLQVKERGSSYPKIVTLINFHFKSQANSTKDPSKSGWETYRMEMAEALRRIIETRHKTTIESGDTLLVLIGDRNSNRDMASARLLEGTVRLRQFQEEGVCRLSKRGVPICQVGSSNPQLLYSLLTTDPQAGLLPGTHKYKKEFSWLDDIIAPANTLRFARQTFDSEGDYDSGLLYEFSQASDHAMTWVKLNW